MSAEAVKEQDARTQGFDPNSVTGTLVVAVVLCLICSLVVSISAVGLKGFEAQNQKNKVRRNVLIAAGIWDPSKHRDSDLESLFQPITTLAVTLPSDGTEGAPAKVELASDSQDSGKAKGPADLYSIPDDQDLAGIGQRDKVINVYLVRDETGKISTIVLPIYGKGLWSTLYGFLALEGDARTVQGITYYQHGETPGLGGEVENPKWKASWHSKVAVDDQGTPVIDVTKPGNATSDRQVDGLSGATITSNGVENMVRYWLGDNGFGPFLAGLRSGELKIPEKSVN